jgi:hypothetical protein
MTQPIDHATCSRLLPSFLAGESGDDAPAISEHLRGCAECRAERAGLEMLLAPVEPPTEGERAQLRAAVRGATFAMGDGSSPQPGEPVRDPGASGPPRSPAQSRRPAQSRGPGNQRHSRRERRWLTPALGAAAAVLLIAGGIALLGHQSPGFKSANSSGRAADRAAGAAAPSPGDVKGFVGAQPASTPSFYPSPLEGVGQISRRAAPLLTAFAHAYDGKQARSMGPPFLARLTKGAPSSLRRQILRCGGRVLAHDPSALPAFGAVARVRQGQALALVFSSSPSLRDPLSRFHLYAWPLGSCLTQIVHRAGPVP